MQSLFLKSWSEKAENTSGKDLNRNGAKADKAVRRKLFKSSARARARGGPPRGGGGEQAS